MVYLFAVASDWCSEEPINISAAGSRSDRGLLRSAPCQRRGCSAVRVRRGTARAPSRDCGRAAVTVAALAGYFALTLSPLEGVALGRFPGDLVALARSNLRNIVGGLVTGPLFGALGWRWRTTHSRASAVLVAAAFCLEPVARLAAGQLSSPAVVWGVEVMLGVALAGYFLRVARRSSAGVAPRLAGD